MTRIIEWLRRWREQRANGRRLAQVCQDAVEAARQARR